MISLSHMELYLHQPNSLFFTGRCPLRTNVLGALGQSDLANYQVSPYAYTLPKLLNQRDYESAIFGKFHIGLQQNNPFEFAVVSALGEDHDSVFGTDEGTCYSADG